jgi:hypothetical protein
MRRYLGFLIFFFVLLGLAIWFWKSRTADDSSSHSQQGQKPNASSINPISTSSRKKAEWEGSNTFIQMPPSIPGQYDPSLPQWIEWDRREKKDKFWEWKVPINFYGKVVDYVTGEPIAGVEILLEWNDLSNEGTSKRKVFTDSSGLFSLVGTTGKILGVAGLKKEGYIRSNANSQFSFEYAAFFDKIYHLPDPNKPVVFRMKKMGETESLLYRETLYGLKPDGTSHYIDFKTGRKQVGGIASGDLALQINRTPTNDPNKPNWILRIHGVGATALLESSEEFMYEAPINGYVDQVKISQNVNDVNYQSQIEKKYFIKLSNGTFARIETHAFAEYNQESAIKIILYLNPTPGSRNLEYDPKKRLFWNAQQQTFIPKK